MEETYFQDWGGPKDPRKTLKTVVIDRDTFDFRKYENFHDLVEEIYCFFLFQSICSNFTQFFVPCKNFQIFSPTTHIFGKTKNDIFLSHEYCLPYYEIFHIFN